MFLVRTDRLLLREWVAEDLPAFAELNADPKVMEYFPRPLTREESSGLVGHCQAHFQAEGFSVLPVLHRYSEQFLGCVGLLRVTPAFPFHPAVELVWRITSEHWGNGYALEGARMLLEVWADHFRNSAVVAFTAKTNSRSESVMKKLGMRACPDEEFEHPRLPASHPLRRHILYRL